MSEKAKAGVGVIDLTFYNISKEEGRLLLPDDMNYPLQSFVDIQKSLGDIIKADEETQPVWLMY
jgi:hypothetical protein